jgi:hypothetical protein
MEAALSSRIGTGIGDLSEESGGEFTLRRILLRSLVGSNRPSYPERCKDKIFSRALLELKK